MTFSPEAEEMHAGAAEHEAQKEIRQAPPEEYGSNDSRDARLAHWILTGGE